MPNRILEQVRKDARKWKLESDGECLTVDAAREWIGYLDADDPEEGGWDPTDPEVIQALVILRRLVAVTVASCRHDNFEEFRNPNGASGLYQCEACHDQWIDSTAVYGVD